MSTPDPKLLAADIVIDTPPTSETTPIPTVNTNFTATGTFTLSFADPSVSYQIRNRNQAYDNTLWVPCNEPDGLKWDMDVNGAPLGEKRLYVGLFLDADSAPEATAFRDIYVTA